MSDSETPWTAARQVPLLSTISQSLLKFMFIKLVMLSNDLILCHPLLLLPSIFPSIRVFSNELALHIRRPKYWSFIFSINPSSEYSGLISFRIDWFDLLKVRGTLKSLLQHQNLKASILQHSASFMARHSHPYMTTGKTIVLTIRTFVTKVMSVLFKALSRFVIAFLSRNSEVAQLCPALCDPMGCSLPVSSVHGIFQAIVLEWIAISFSSSRSKHLLI